MIDLHTHILPGVDDGPDDWDEALAMLQIASASGTGTIVATPHSHERWRGGTPCVEIIKRLTLEANHRARQAGLTLEVLPGQECYAEPTLATELQAGKWLTLGNPHVVLLEFPFSMWPPFVETLVFDLQVAGYTILLAHAERYRAVCEQPNIIFDLVEKGVYIQVTSASLFGKFGEQQRKTAHVLLKHNLVHILASDSHTSNDRAPDLKLAYDQMREMMGESVATRLVVDNPRMLLNDQPLPIEEPRRIVERQAKRFFGWLA